MIVASAPLRVSILGGGSDLPDFFQKHSGAVLGGSIDKRVYVALLDMDKSAEFPFRFTYRQVDNVISKSEIRHPVVRTILELEKELNRINIATLADIPGNSGLGSSSAFTVALLAALNEYQNRDMGKQEIAELAISVERELIAEAGGWQDQIHATYGGFRFYEFAKDNYSASENLISFQEQKEWESSSVLVKVGGFRSSATQHSQISSLNSSLVEENLLLQSNLARKGYEIFCSEFNFNQKLIEISKLINESWHLKETLLGGNSHEVNETIAKGESFGAYAAKLCGAGGSGYVLFLGESHSISSIRQYFGDTRTLNFKFENRGVDATRV